MILKKLSLLPCGLFEPVEFINGVNYIFGKKAHTGDAKKSLNAIGKSTFLDIIDFCLLAQFNQRDSKRLHAAYEKGILKGITAELIFQIHESECIIQRDFDDPGAVRFSENREGFAEHRADDLKIKLCHMIFFKPDYSGRFEDKWFRTLMGFFLKIQKPKKERFTDPVVYIRHRTPAEMNLYHLYLMNLDNSASYDIFQANVRLKEINPAIKEIERLIREDYQLRDIPEAESKARRLKIDIEELEKAFEKFKLSGLYKADEEKANNLTAEIKKLWLQNHRDRKKLEAYQESLKGDVDFNTRRIGALYQEFNELFAQQVKKTLNDAIRFKKQLLDSRHEFLQEEMAGLKARISERENEITKKEEERKIIFEFLNAKEAISDLTGAFKALSGKKSELLDIESRTGVYRDLIKKQNKVEQEIKEIEGRILEFIKAIEAQVLELTRLFSAIYNALYPELKDSSFVFDIGVNKKTDAKIELNILTNTQMFSKGKNQGRTLIYDLTILFSMINRNLNGPRFLVHDGIFDGMDKAHFIALYQFLEEQKLQGKKFQYILTFNEEGTLKDNFGKSDLVTVERIEKEAVLALTPAKKLLGDF